MTTQETQVVDLVWDKAAAENAAPEWILAFAALQVVPIVREIGDTLKAIHSAIDERDLPGSSLGERLHGIEGVLQNIFAAKDPRHADHDPTGFRARRVQQDAGGRRPRRSGRSRTPEAEPVRD
jgi:hypothetical protein